MIVRLHPERAKSPLHNFWSNVHFHPTDAIEDDWGQRILDRIAKDGAARAIRMYAMLEDIVTQDEQGELHFDFTLNDTRLDYLLSRGFSIFLSYNFIPPCISSDTEERSTVCRKKTRYKGKYILTAAPRDYGLWERICREYTKHIVERYGLDTVASWQLQCYNEPDIGIFFMSDATVEERCREYCKLYDGFAAGVLSVSDRLQVGGPALAEEYDFLRGFLTHVKEHGTRLDFLCFHSYGTTPTWMNDGTKPLCVENHKEKLSIIRDMLKEYSLERLPVIIDEWGGSICGYFNSEECPELMFRETPVFAAYYAKLLTFLCDFAMPIDKIMLCLSGQHEMTTDFSGFRNFFTLNGYPKPIYQAFVLAARLGTHRLQMKTDGDDRRMTVLPTAFEDGRIAVLLSYANETFLPDGAAEVVLQITGADACTARLTRIDSTHANAYAAYLSMGSPDSPTEDERRAIAAAGELICEPITAKGDTVSVCMEANSIALLELFPASQKP